MVAVKVGPSEHEFHVHKGLICHHSEYFRAAFKGGFQESNGVVKLDKNEIAVFQGFFDWLYTGKVTYGGKQFQLVEFADTRRLFRLYFF